MAIATDSAFFTWMIELLRAIAAWRTPVLDALMSAVTWLGEGTVFLFVGLILFWCVDKKYGYRFLFVNLAGTFCGLGLKVVCRIPRPWVIDPSLKIVESARAGATGWSFPSGHTAAATMLFGGVARKLERPWAYVVSVVLALTVAFSRMYLGVHTLLDVVVGLLLGVCTLLLSELLFRKAKDKPLVSFLCVAAVAALCVAATVLAAVTEAEGGTGGTLNMCALTGTAFGLLIGGEIERRFVRFEQEAPWWVQALKILLGLGLLLGLRVGLKAGLGLVTDLPYANVIRYFILSVAGVALYPMTFRLWPKRKQK